MPFKVLGMHKPPRKNFAFLTFPSQEDKDKMIEIAEQIKEFKGKKIKLKATEMLNQKSDRTLEEILKPKERKIVEIEDYKEQTIEERIMGLANVPYPK
jgi:hypothetical protein